MSDIYLDKTGLAYFWSKIKAWCNATFAAITHSHAWSAITGKPTTVSGYGITDAKIDNGTITLGSNSITPLTSHQDISGKVNKSGDTMTGNLTVPSVIISGSFIKQHPSITKGTNPSATSYWTLSFSDKAGSNYSNNCLGMLETSITSAGVVSTYIRAMKNTAANSSNCQISCIYDTANNTAYTAAPTPATADNSTKIATTAFVKAQGYLTSHQDISGKVNKSGDRMTGDLKISTSTANQLRLIAGNYGVIFRNDGDGFYLLQTASGQAEDGSWNNARPLTVNLSTGVCDINGSAATSIEASRLKSSTPDSTAQKVVFTGGQLAIGTSAGNAYIGSSNNVQLISVPEDGTYITQTNANVQNLRFVWSGDYFSDIFVSPNDKYVWHRDVANKVAYSWRRLVEENADGIPMLDWNISIAGNASTASAFNSAKSIALTGIVTGTASSTGGWTIATKPRMCRCLGGANGETRYFKVASGSLGIAWNMFDVVFLVQDYIYHSQIGLWHVRLANGATAGVIGGVVNQFVLNANIESVGDFYLCYKNGENGNPAQYELYVAFTGASQGFGFIVLSEMERFEDKVATSLTLYNGAYSDYVTSLPSGFTVLAATNAPIGNLPSGVVPIANGGTGSSTKNFIDLTSNQNNIAGDKSFSNNLQVRNTWPHFHTCVADYTYGSTLPSSARYAGMLIYDNIDKIIGTTEYCLMPNGDALMNIAVVGINQNVSTGVCVCHGSDNYRMFRPNGDNVLYLGNAYNRWKSVHAATGSIQTSDERLKLKIAPVPDAVLDAWLDAGFRQFKFSDAVGEKGGAARLHVGMIAQDIGRAFGAHGLLASDYGLFCHDEWDASPAAYATDGKTVVQEAREAGDCYSLRYEEALCMEAACMRRENARLKKRIADLEERLAALELKVS